MAREIHWFIYYLCSWMAREIHWQAGSTSQPITGHGPDIHGLSVCLGGRPANGIAEFYLSGAQPAIT
jgi:hypothetical protein